MLTDILYGNKAQKKTLTLTLILALTQSLP